MRIAARMRKTAYLVLMLTLIFGTSSCSMIENKEAAERAVHEFHHQLNAKHYHEIYTEADEEFQKAGDEAYLTKFLSAAHLKLGDAGPTQMTDWRVNYSNLGTTVSIRCETKFSNGDAVEEFMYRMQDKEPVLLSYNINSPVFITGEPGGTLSPPTLPGKSSSDI